MRMGDDGVRLAGSIHKMLHDMALRPGKDVDILVQIQGLAGIFVETAYLFDNPEEAISETLRQLENNLRVRLKAGPGPRDLLPAPDVLDVNTEAGRDIARAVFIDWLEDPYTFHTLMVTLAEQMIINWEREACPRAETLYVLTQATTEALMLELAAQELCDALIEECVAKRGWNLADSICALSGSSGVKLAGWLKDREVDWNVFEFQTFWPVFDRVSRVMTREAVRYGVPVSSNWRFGIPANDGPINAPVDLVAGIEEFCDLFFDAAEKTCKLHQAVACAKAAGRMLAVASGGEQPDLIPEISKPLAMGAMTEAYRAVFGDNFPAILQGGRGSAYNYPHVT